MRILAISDIHGSHKALKKLKISAKKADLVIIAGDFTIFQNHIEQIMKNINSWKKKVLLITGNHENHNTVKRLCQNYSNIYFMNNKIMKINNNSNTMLIYGYDTDGFNFRDKLFERDSLKFVKAIKKINQSKKAARNIRAKESKTILISHAPVYGTKTDKVMDEHCGNKSVKEFCIKNKINYCFCGHIHEASHTIDRLGKTIVVNPGPYGMMFEI
ncbi:MAG: metallophosphoesterase [Candidatus Woesearchaeota archaeon]